MQKGSVRITLGKVVRNPIWFFLTVFFSIHYIVFFGPYALNLWTRNQRRRVVVFGDSLTQLGNDPNMVSDNVYNVVFGICEKRWWKCTPLCYLKTGWVASLAHHYGRRIDVYNRGYSGYNSKWGLSILDQSVIHLKPDLVTLFWGI